MDELKQSDYLEIIPFNGRKKTVKLSYTLIEIRFCHETISIEQKLGRITIPCLKGEEGEIRIRYLEGGFRVDSIQGIFHLNSNKCMSAYPKLNDRVEVGHNILDFKRMVRTKTLYLDEVLDNVGHSIVSSQVDILISGETGSGKTTLAKKIHLASSATGDFIHICLSAFSRSVLESELFGHVKGAFTGAIFDKPGVIELAEGGTLFLDEIDSLPLDLQLKLLLFLDSKKYRKVGALKESSANVRLIFAAGSSLQRLVEKKRMRRDFFYRINCSIPIDLKNLRGDESFIMRMISEVSNDLGVIVDKDLLKVYGRGSWPGNVRQLRSHLKKKALLSNRKRLSYDQFDFELEEQGRSVQFPEYQFLSLPEVRYQHCLKVFKAMGESVNRSSDILKVSPNTVRSILKSVN